MKEKTSKKGAFIALICVAALLILTIVLENTLDPTKNIMLFTVLKKGAVYALVASSMNLLNGFTGLFSLGQAGFMLLGAYTYAILTIPAESRDAVYYLYGGSSSWRALWRRGWPGSSAFPSCGSSPTTWPSPPWALPRSSGRCSSGISWGL